MVGGESIGGRRDSGAGGRGELCWWEVRVVLVGGESCAGGR